MRRLFSGAIIIKTRPKPDRSRRRAITISSKSGEIPQAVYETYLPDGQTEGLADGLTHARTDGRTARNIMPPPPMLDGGIIMK